MIKDSKEASFSSKVLNKFLPSDLINEIDEKEQKVLNLKSYKLLNDFVFFQNVKYIINNIFFLFIEYK